MDLLVFHDESEPKPWFVTGLLWCSKGDLSRIVSQLGAARQQEGYCGEVHFNALGSDFLRTRLARRWFRAFATGDLEGLKAYVLVIDKHPGVFKPGRFPQRFHAYNRFTAMALYSSFRWFWTNVNSSSIFLYSDKKQRRPPGVIEPDGVNTDNFEDYLPARFELDTRHDARQGALDSGGCQGNNAVNLVSLIDSAAKTTDSRVRGLQDMIQLCDLVTGAVAQAFSGASSRPVKQNFGFQAAKLVRLVEPAVRYPNRELLQRFNVSVFPDVNGKFRRTLFPLASRHVGRTLDDYAT